MNWVSARSAPQILSVKGECNFLLSNFLIIGFCNSSATSLWDIISFLTVPPERIYQKKYKLLKQVHVDIHHISDF